MIENFRLPHAMLRDNTRYSLFHNVRVFRFLDMGPVLGLQWFDLGSAVPCAKLCEDVSATCVKMVRELVNAIAGL